MSCGQHSWAVAFLELDDLRVNESCWRGVACDQGRSGRALMIR